MEEQKSRKNEFFGLFIIGIAFAMFVLGGLYLFTSNLNSSWAGFGVVYAASILGILGNKKLKQKLGVDSNKKIIKPPAIIILVLGIMLSCAVGMPHGERYALSGVLITVGLHFLFLKTKGAGELSLFILAFFIILNGAAGILMVSYPAWLLIFTDGMIKLLVGAGMIIKGRNS